MMQLLRTLKGKYIRASRKRQRIKIDAFVAAYIKQNNLTGLITQANTASTSTGTELYDYVVLHSYVRKHKVKYILECGTGKTTWILADALQKNHLESGVEGKVISMESIAKWYEEAVRIFPEHLKQYAEIILSPATTFLYSFVKGTTYTQVPDHPYDLVFVDGPELTITENGNSYETVNMDLVRYVLSTDRPVTAIVDSRLRTCVAYGIVFGKNKVKFLKPWLIGIVENVSRKDLMINIDGGPLSQMLKHSTVFKFDTPSWIKNEL